jgi:acyl carrier protein
MKKQSRDEIKKTVIEIVAKVLNVDSNEITEDKELDTDLRIDSLALYEIVVDIEDYYSLRISNDEADDLKTVREAIDFIEQKVNALNH